MLANFFEWKQVDKLKHESLHLDEELEEGKMYFHSKEELSSPDTSRICQENREPKVHYCRDVIYQMLSQ